jgi:ubiquinone biosynthesis protein
MLDVSLNEPDLERFRPEELQAAFFSAYPTSSERIGAIEAMLRSPTGPILRDRIGRWVIQRLPAEELVPDKYARWRPLVQDAMLFVFLHLSIERLAPKLVEQMELPSNTPTGARLLKLIARVPGLQKLGQVLARNRHLLPKLRRALMELENGISDMNAEQVRAIIVEELGQRLEANAVTIRPGIFFEASVSAVVRFTWRDSDTGRRERGVFKVMKPHIPACFAEDMRILAQLAKYVGSKTSEYGFAQRLLPETFSDVRRLLEHEVRFSREQATLVKASRIYGSMLRVRVPRVVPALCTSKITAMTEERGTKVTDAVARLPEWRRARVSELLIEAFLAAPIFSSDKEAMLHADPHAGNLLYDKRTGELVILDWALTEHVSLEERRHLALLFLFTALRDPGGIFDQIQALSRGGARRKGAQAKIIRGCVENFIAQLPLTRVPGAADALGLLEAIAMKGVRLPAPLIMLRKVLFTLDGVQHDIGDPEVSTISIVARLAVQRGFTGWKGLGSMLSLKDWLAVESSTLLYSSRVCWQGAQAFLARSRNATRENAVQLDASRC